MNDNKLRIKAVEVIFGVLIFIITAIVTGKYLSIYLTGKDLAFNMTELLVKYVNNSYSENKKVGTTYRDYTLKLDKSGSWSLFSNGIVANELRVVESVGKIKIIRSELVGKTLNLRIDSVTDYFSRNGEILTDIPYFSGVQEFFVPEQEDLFPIIGYHNVFTNEDDMTDPYIDMRKDDFEEQLRLLSERMGCRWFTLAEVTQNYLLTSKKIPRNTCVLTFDDGRSNNYQVVLPILNQFNAKATFFVIAGRFGQRSYMNIWQISKLFQSGNEIESHSLTGGSLVDTSWYRGNFTPETLWEQVGSSINLLNGYGFDTKLFAYPLGDYSDSVVSAVKKAGYISARATNKANTWRTPRALATSLDDEFIWHLNYYEPELKYDYEILSDISYDGWWQFEEGLEVLHDPNKNITTQSQDIPTTNSYGVISLEDPSDTVANSFILGNDGFYQIDIFASSRDGSGNFEVLVDDLVYRVVLDNSQQCLATSKGSYCHYIVSSSLKGGRHILSVISLSGNTKLDRFRINRIVLSKTEYSVRIEED